MNRLHKLESIVEVILTEQPDTRADDMLLYVRYVGKVTTTVPAHFYKIFADKEYRQVFGLSTPESVGRCRRKLQADKPHLRPSQEVQDMRFNETAEYMDYAIGGRKGGFMDYIESLDKEVIK